MNEQPKQFKEYTIIEPIAGIAGLIGGIALSVNGIADGVFHKGANESDNNQANQLDNEASILTSVQQGLPVASDAAKVLEARITADQAKAQTLRAEAPQYAGGQMWEGAGLMLPTLVIGMFGPMLAVTAIRRRIFNHRHQSQPPITEPAV